MSEKSRRGFAGMDPEKLRSISRKGGQTAHRRGSAHKFNSEEAADAGKRGGRAVSQDREHMAEIGRKGGLLRSSRGGDGSSTDLVREASPAETREDTATGDPTRNDHTPPSPITSIVSRDIQTVNAVGVGSMYMLLENGPFGGCVIRLEGESQVPCKVWIDRSGMVVASTPDATQEAPSWVGLTVEPIPVLDMTGTLEAYSEFGYEKTTEREEGFEGVFRFTDSRSRAPTA